MSPQKASSGIEITSATMRGMTSHSTGLSPIVRMASTSWLTCMVPIWAVKALPQRPDPDRVHLAHHGIDAKAARLQAGLDEDHQDLAKEGREVDALMVEVDRV